MITTPSVLALLGLIATTAWSCAAPPGVMRDVEYARVGEHSLKLDLHWPERASRPAPLLIYVHGGAWRAGSKDEMPLGPLVEQGFAVASVDYRLTTAAPFPANVHDLKAAVRFLRAKASEFGFDPKRFAILGSSAGGHLAALVGVSSGNKELEGEVGAHREESSAVQAIVSFYGASNLQTILAQSTPHGLSVRVPALGLLLGGQPDEKTELARLASPVAHVDAGDPPLLLIHGDADPQMPIAQSRELQGVYEKAVRPVRFEVVPGGQHGGHEFYDEARLRIVAEFLRASLPPSPSVAKPTQGPGNPADHLPPHIRQLTHFGERAEFSHDGQRVLFLNKQYGDVMEYTIRSGKIRCLSQHFKHHGFNRVMMLSNGDYLLTGTDETFDATSKEARLKARHFAKMWVLDQSLTKPPTPLGAVAAEGPAVSRTQLKIAWTHHIEGAHRQTAISAGDIVYENGVPRLANTRLVLTCNDFPAGQRPQMIETQNFIGPDDRAITLSAYLIENGHNTESYLFDLESRKLTNFTNTPDDYEEVEGIFPDHASTLVERNRSVGAPWPMVDAWRVWFDGSREPQRLTRFLDFPGYKAANYVVSDDGRLMAFQIGISGDEAGVGYGIFLYEFEKAGAAPAKSAARFERRATPLAQSIWAVDALDANGDGKRDFIAVGETKVWALLAPDLRAVELADTPGGRTIHAVALDCDGDGDPDLALGRSASDWIRHRESIAAGKPSKEPAGEDWTVAWIENTGRTDQPWPLHRLDRELHGVHGVWFGDVNRDGRVDLLANSFAGPHLESSLAWFAAPFAKDAPVGSLRRMIITGKATGRPHYMDFADINRDGRGDVLLGATAEGSFTWWEQPADLAEEWTRHIIAMEPGGSHPRAADLNGDGQLDVFGSTGHGVGVYWYAAPAWTRHVIEADLRDVHAFDVADLDGDGDLDAAGCSFSAKIVRWWENLGGGKFVPHDLDTGHEQQAYDLKIADLDGDGRRDILLAGRQSKNAVWYRQLPPPK